MKTKKKDEAGLCRDLDAYTNNCQYDGLIFFVLLWQRVL